MAMEPPEPDSVPPLVQFTKEDTINMDTSNERKAEEDISMIVHIDESQDDLDADLETPKKQPAEKNKDTTTDDAAVDKKEPEAAKPDNKQNDTNAEKKSEETTNGDASSEVKSSEKPATASDKKDIKKDETSSDAKKETRLVCMLQLLLA